MDCLNRYCYNSLLSSKGVTDSDFSSVTFAKLGRSLEILKCPRSAVCIKARQHMPRFTMVSIPTGQLLDNGRSGVSDLLEDDALPTVVVRGYLSRSDPALPLGSGW